MQASEEATAVMTEEWTREGALFVEPRLARLGVPHGLTARGLGPMADAERRSAAAREAGIIDDVPLVLKQVHGKILHEAQLSNAGSDGDGWIAGPGFLAGVFVADCLPLFVWNDALSKIAVVHAGWRGIAAGIVEETVGRFEGSLSASVGPHIGVCCYEVGSELRNDFDGAFFQESHLNLGAVVKAKLEAAGLASEAIGISSLCTKCGEDDFFSFRRDKQRRNMMAFAGLPR